MRRRKVNLIHTHHGLAPLPPRHVHALRKHCRIGHVHKTPNGPKELGIAQNRVGKQVKQDGDIHRVTAMAQSVAHRLDCVRNCDGGRELVLGVQRPHSQGLVGQPRLHFEPRLDHARIDEVQGAERTVRVQTTVSDFKSEIIARNEVGKLLGTVDGSHDFDVHRG
ncbi:hypothetical protein BCR44DRAFT_238396 [Catenaria anguillulae PL171]|uniref:Uncharacterized protein n=1 Tax=Catenaria anguillulae PL171 TaxID=765915 RepID=A0A1Y2HCU5_9FUNG|nr:hypothetical protein BCR44DRAFT_238396 [Catenaria anguillulae PL171]